MADASIQTGLEQAVEQLGLTVSPIEIQRLLGFMDLLQRWNSSYNLTAVRDPQQMLSQHLADCLAVIRPMRRQLGPREAARVLDVGSGAGLPGVVIAALNPELQVVCVDAVGKKAAFITQVIAELKLRNLDSMHARVEALKAVPFDLVTSRAFASLADFVSLTRAHLEVGGVWMAMKGKRPEAELDALPPTVRVFHVEQLVVPGLNADRCLVWMNST